MLHYYPLVMLLSRFVGISILCLVAGATESPGRRNVTIDDHLGDEMTHAVPMYTPSDSWVNQGNILPQPWPVMWPNASLAHNQTWHAPNLLVGSQTVNFDFTGISIYVYCIAASMPAGTVFNSLAGYKFSIDGVPVGQYKTSADKTLGYDVLVYANTTLENVAHNFSITVDSGFSVLLIFDRAVYTIITDSANTLTSTRTSTTNLLASSQPTYTATSSPPSSVAAPDEANASKPPRITGLIVGATLAGLAAFILIGTLIYHRWWKVNRSGQQLISQQWRRSRFLLYPKSWPPASSRHADDEKVDRTPIQSPVRGSANTRSQSSLV